MCTLVALSAAKHENESKKTKRGILTGSPYNQYGYAQPSLSLGAGQVVQTYAAQPAVLSSYGGQSSLAYRSVAVAPSYGHSYAAQPAVSYAASPVYRSVSVQHVPQVIVREKYPGNMLHKLHIFSSHQHISSHHCEHVECIFN